MFIWTTPRYIWTTTFSQMSHLNSLFQNVVGFVLTNSYIDANIMQYNC